MVNTYSLSEMTQGCADHLMHCIHDVLRPRFLYSRNYMFTDKSIHFDTGGLDGEANEIVLKLRPEWQPLRFDLTPSIGDSGYRVAGSAVLRRIAPRSVQESVKEMTHAASKVERGSPEWLGYMYLAALWADDRVVTEGFFAGLRQFFADRAIDARPEFNFDNIGEVKFLRRRLKMACVRHSVRRRPASRSRRCRGCSASRVPTNAIGLNSFASYATNAGDTAHPK